jgi:hypothetical protein
VDCEGAVETLGRFQVDFQGQSSPTTWLSSVLAVSLVGSRPVPIRATVASSEVEIFAAPAMSIRARWWDIPRFFGGPGGLPAQRIVPADAAPAPTTAVNEATTTTVTTARILRDLMVRSTCPDWRLGDTEKAGAAPATPAHTYLRNVNRYTTVIVLSVL